MKYLSVCSGIEAATVAWHDLGFEPVAFSEIEPFPSAVLRAQYPGVPNLGDMTKINGHDFAGKIDLLVGGTPCQSFSVAGLRGGLGDARGNLSLVFMRLAAQARPRYVLWENVPGALSSHGGRDFGAIVGALEELGYGWAYRTLDARFFGVPQRRRRVFLVGCLGGAAAAREVLFERESLRGDPPPSRREGQGASAYAIRCAQTSSNGWGIQRDVTHTLDQTGGPAVLGPAAPSPGGPLAFHNRQDPDVSGDVTHPLGAQGNGMGVLFPGGPGVDAYNGVLTGQEAATLGAASGGTNTAGPKVFASPAVLKIRAGCEGGGKGPLVGYDESFTLAAAQDQTLFAPPAVRRLTPRECERLQGFPDDYTAIEYRGKPAPDGPRYKALGNSMAVPVMRWIGRRLIAAQ